MLVSLVQAEGNWHRTCQTCQQLGTTVLAFFNCDVWGLHSTAFEHILALHLTVLD